MERVISIEGVAVGEDSCDVGDGGEGGDGRPMDGAGDWRRTGIVAFGLEPDCMFVLSCEPSDLCFEGGTVSRAYARYTIRVRPGVSIADK